MCGMCMMSSFLVVAGFMVLRGFSVVAGGMLMMVCGVIMVLGGFLGHSAFLTFLFQIENSSEHIEANVTGILRLHELMMKMRGAGS